jgi:hypothetical protein
MSHHNIKKLIESLEEIQQRPGMYFADAFHCYGFLSGVSFSMTILGFIDSEVYYRAYRRCASRYGYTWVANSFYAQLQDEGHEESEIILTLLKAEVETWREVLEDMDDAS